MIVMTMESRAQALSITAVEMKPRFGFVRLDIGQRGNIHSEALDGTMLMDHLIRLKTGTSLSRPLRRRNRS